MNKFNHKLSLFSVLTFLAFQHSNLQATDNNIPKVEGFNKQIKTNLKFSDPLQDILQRIKNGNYVSKISLDNLTNTALEEMKWVDIHLMSNDDMFDSWITLILNSFSRKHNFIRSLKTAKEKGESELATPAAQYNLGLLYCKGRSVDRDLIKAIGYIEKAAEGGHAVAQYSVGIIYQLGKGVHQDLIKAFMWSKKAAEQGHVIAQYNLGSMYRYGEGVNQDLAQALKWYLEFFKNTHIYSNIKVELKDSIQSFVTFNSKTIFLKDESDYIINLGKLEDKIKKFLELRLLELRINDQDLSFKPELRLRIQFEDRF